MPEARAFPTRVGIPAETRRRMINLLNQHLADAFDLYSQTKQAHWNVKGLQFIALHELFDKLAEDLEEAIDDMAERVTALGGTALGTVRIAAASSSIAEYPLDITDGPQHIEALAERFGRLAGTVRSAIDTATEAGDADTADLFTEVSRMLDKNLWFLEAHVQA
jgi:starvation-inducible DNA-binding protein